MTAISDADFAALADFMSREAGLVFDTSRRPALTAVVLERLAESGRRSVAEYLTWVSVPDGAEERLRLFDAVTIQETHFFRNGAQIEALRHHLLPELMRRAAEEGRPLRIWSAGCSTGEEPYTLAMLALEVRAALRLQLDIVIVGTDVSAAAIAVAEAATYAGRTIDLAEEGALEQWFELLPDGSSRVRDEVREVVLFRRHNLVADEPPFAPGALDLVVCRNVTIYFARETTRALVERFHDTLRPGGFLVLGHAETLWQISDSFALVPVAEAFAYRKDAVPAPGSPEAAAAAVADAAGAASALRRPRGGPVRVPTGPGGPNRAGLGPTRLRPMHSPPLSSVPDPTDTDGPGRRAADPLVSAAARSIARTADPRPRARSTGVDALIAARQAWAEGRYSQVVDLSARATHVDPLLTDAYILGGQARSTLGDDHGALDELRKAVYLEPSAGHAHFLLGGALSRLGRPGSAARSFRAAAASLPLVAPEQIRFLLDGRDVGELVALCDQLAAASERAAEATPVESELGDPITDRPVHGRSTR